MVITITQESNRKVRLSSESTAFQFQFAMGDHLTVSNTNLLEMMFQIADFANNEVHEDCGFVVE